MYINHKKMFDNNNIKIVIINCIQIIFDLIKAIQENIDNQYIIINCQLSCSVHE